MSDRVDPPTEAQASAEMSFREWSEEGYRIWSDAYSDQPEDVDAPATAGPPAEAGNQKHFEAWYADRTDDLADLAVAADDLHLTSKIPDLCRKTEAQVRILENRGDAGGLFAALGSALEWREEGRWATFLRGCCRGLRSAGLAEDLGLLEHVMELDHESEHFHQAITSLAVPLRQGDLVRWSDREDLWLRPLAALARSGDDNDRERALAAVDPAGTWKQVAPVFEAAVAARAEEVRQLAVSKAVAMDDAEVRALCLAALSGTTDCEWVRELAAAASEAPGLDRASRHRVTFYAHHERVFRRPPISARDNVRGLLAVSLGSLEETAGLRSDRHAQRVLSRIAVDGDREELVRSFDGRYERAVALSELSKRRQDAELAIEALEEAPGTRAEVRGVIHLLEILRADGSRAAPTNRKEER